MSNTTFGAWISPTKKAQDRSLEPKIEIKREIIFHWWIAPGAFGTGQVGRIADYQVRLAVEQKDNP